MLTSQNALIYAYVLWLIGRRDFGLDTKTLRGVIARWFFMAHTTGRYTGSFETQIEADLGRLTAHADGSGEAFCDELDRLVRATFTNDYWEISLPNRLDTSSARSPVLSAYQAALNLLDAEALFSDLRLRDLLDPAVTAPRSLERHHLFPKAHLAAKGITGTRNVNAIANMAYLDWPDNAIIAADDPLLYWPAMTARLDPDRLERQIYWHALPIGWEQLDYIAFCDRRRTLLAGVVRDGFNTLWEDGTPEPAEGVADLVGVGESQTVEFKSTARWNLQAGRPDKRMEHAITKTVCGFLNAQGGKLLIGVDDGGNVVGLGSDLQTLRNRDNDDYELFLRQMLDDSLSVPTAGTIRVGFERVDGEDVCVVSASSSGKPVFAKPHEGHGGHSEFWVRVGNATKQLPVTTWWVTSPTTGADLVESSGAQPAWRWRLCRSRGVALAPENVDGAHAEAVADLVALVARVKQHSSSECARRRNVESVAQPGDMSQMLSAGRGGGLDLHGDHRAIAAFDQ